MGRLAVSELTTFRWSFEDDVAQYQAAGVPAIGVWRQKLADVGDEKGAEILAEAGLVASSLQWAGGFTGSDGRSHEESLADARHAIVTAAALRAGCLIIHTGARGVHTHNHARRLFRLALDKLLPLAEERGVVLALEPMNCDCGGEFTFLNCFDETLELVASYDSIGLGIALDTYHWGHQPQLLERLPDLASQLTLVQLGDAREPPCGEPNRCQLGDGTIPLREIVHSLAAAGYEGFYEVELMGEEIETADYRDVLARSVRTFQEWMGGREPKVESPKPKVVFP
ncbi:MAG TPA: sugar phosphate isomerase/epimerase family protein [Pirellulaceae bacterium]|nr:sugar phosphate isomerase/epimerase family protein [Pirellulaceae bacterium]